MDVGISLPTASSCAWEPGLTEFARRAEENGAASVWVNDHLTMVANPGSPYPYSSNRRIDWNPGDPQIEATIALAQAAAVTTTVRIGSAVLVLPQRNPLELAKTTASLDALSGGRLQLGVGAGWLAEEMLALGYSFASRGTRMDECVQILRACWSGSPEPFDGEHMSLPAGVLMYPRPAQKTGVPILVGGMSRRSMRRAAQLGDGWLAVADVNRLGSEELVASLKWIERQRAAHGRAGRSRRLLKVNCQHAESSRQCAKAVETAARSGFDEVILDVSWEQPNNVWRNLRAGLDAASHAPRAVPNGGL